MDCRMQAEEIRRVTVTSLHLHAPHWHAPHVPASFSLMGAILGVIVAPVAILGLLFLFARALSGLP